HVGRALRHRRHQPARRLPAVVVGHLLADVVGHRDLRGHARAVPVPAAAVPALPAGDLHRRDEGAAAGGAGRAAPNLGRPRHGPAHPGDGGHMTTRPMTYGLLAEFERPEDLVAAARRAHAEGYRRMDAYVPFPIEELGEALGFRKTRMPLVVLIGGIIGCAT